MSTSDSDPPPFDALQLVRRENRDSRERLNTLDDRVAEIEKDMVAILGRSGADGRIKSLEDTVRLHMREIDGLRAFQWKVIGAATLAGIFVGLIATIISKVL